MLPQSPQSLRYLEESRAASGAREAERLIVMAGFATAAEGTAKNAAAITATAARRIRVLSTCTPFECVLIGSRGVMAAAVLLRLLALRRAEVERRGVGQHPAVVHVLLEGHHREPELLALAA